MRRIRPRIALPTIAAFLLVTSPLVDAAELEFGVTDGTRYGFDYDGVDDNPESATFTFERDEEELTLRYTAYDVDFDGEIRVYLNGRRVGDLDRTPDRATADGSLTLPPERLRRGTNSLQIRQKNPGYRWGVTNLKLAVDGATARASGPVTLVLDKTDGDRYGYLYLGENGHPEEARFVFDSAADDALQLYYQAYDIDRGDEISVELNGRRVGALAVTPNDRARDNYLLLPQKALRRGRNELVFRQRFPAYRWGVTDLLLVYANWCA